MEKSYTYHPDLSRALPEIIEDSIISRSLFKNNRMDVTLFGFAAGQELTAHTSPHNALIEVLEGELELTLGDEKIITKAGAWVRMAPNLTHALKANTRVVMLLTLVYS